jgi:hypothetical protein
MLAGATYAPAFFAGPANVLAGDRASGAAQPPDPSNFREIDRTKPAGRFVFNADRQAAEFAAAACLPGIGAPKSASRIRHRPRGLPIIKELPPESGSVSDASPSARIRPDLMHV